MGDGDPVVKASALAKFAAQVRAWRQRSGWSQVELAGKILCSDSLVSGVETLNKTPTLDFARRLDEAFDLPGTFMALHDLISREAWPSYFAPVIDFETRAVRIHEWELRVVPGLLQTEDYARSVISAGKPRLSPDALDRSVSRRIERQRILTRDNAPMLWAVLHEGTLRHMVGGREVMAGQLDKIIDVATAAGCRGSDTAVRRERPSRYGRPHLGVRFHGRCLRCIRRVQQRRHDRRSNRPGSGADDDHKPDPCGSTAPQRVNGSHCAGQE